MPSPRLDPGYLDERESSSLSSRSALHGRMWHKDGLWPLRIFIDLNLRKDGPSK